MRGEQPFLFTNLKDGTGCGLPIVGLADPPTFDDAGFRRQYFLALSERNLMNAPDPTDNRSQHSCVLGLAYFSCFCLDSAALRWCRT